jgi:hypothetical protein
MIRAVGSAVAFLGGTPLPSFPELLANDSFRIAENGISGAPVGRGPFPFSTAQSGVVTHFQTASGDSS